MDSNARRVPLRRLLAVLTVAAMFAGVMAAVAPVVAFAADCPITHVGPCVKPGDPDDPPPPPDPCAVLTHVPEGCVQPDPDDDDDHDPCLVMTHVPEHCLPDPDGEPDECPDLTNIVLSHVVDVDVPEECLEPDDNPEGGQDGDDGGDQGGDDGSDDDTDTSSGSLPDPQSAPDLPMTGGSYLGYALAGVMLTAGGVASLIHGRRRETD